MTRSMANQLLSFPLSQLQVLRYSALVAGLFYGVYHQSSLNSQTRHAEATREYERKANLIEQAKAEWKKKTAPPAAPQTQSSGGMCFGSCFSFFAQIGKGGEKKAN